jgi:hypothetical protein
MQVAVFRSGAGVHALRGSSRDWVRQPPKISVADQKGQKCRTLKEN